MQSKTKFTLRQVTFGALDDLPLEIMFPIFIEQYMEDSGLEDVSYIISYLSEIFGSPCVLHHIRSIILYLLQQNHKACWEWILENDHRSHLFLDVFYRNIVQQLQNSRKRACQSSIHNERVLERLKQKKILYDFLDVLCKYGRKDILRFINECEQSELRNFLPRNTKECICILAAKHGQKDLVWKFIYDYSLDKTSNMNKNYISYTLNLQRARLAFQAALSEGKDIIYENLFDNVLHIIDWKYSDKDYNCAQMGEHTIDGMKKSPLRFLLKYDPRTFHVTPFYKLVHHAVLDSSSTRRCSYRLKEPLKKDDCLSNIHYANYTEE